MSTLHEDAGLPAVRFSAVNEEIDPDPAVQQLDTTGNIETGPEERHITEMGEKELQSLNQTLSQAGLQSKRMENFNFEVYSLPASRVPSDSGTGTPSLAHSSIPSPKHSPPATEYHSPPLTPAGSDPREIPRPTSSSRLRPPSASSSRPKSMSDVPSVTPSHPEYAPHFTIGPTGDSLPTSQDQSPSVTPGSATPGQPESRSFTPSGEKEEAHVSDNRPPQPKNSNAIDPRFIFAGRDHRRPQQHLNHNRSQSPGSSRKHSQPQATAAAAADAHRSDAKRHSIFGGGAFAQEKRSDGSDSASGKHGSMSELKRFLRLGHKHKNKDKRASSPAPNNKAHKSGTSTPTSTHSTAAVPFADDHGLQSKYGKFGRVLGAGAGGSVRLMKRSSDGVTFAVKQFRARHAHESVRDYNKKVTAEFCIGSTLHHGNIIETMDLINEKDSWYVVMEYAPFDLFAIVMTGKMSREEITCCTLQIFNGVMYLHEMGLSHRDLKLDNVVVNEHGIMKIIDFGSAAVFKYPLEKEIVQATGIVGSDPYLAPEVYDLQQYDPQPADVWSLAIIFCCMTLRRFPWKAPRISDNSYKLFIAPPDNHSFEDSRQSSAHHPSDHHHGRHGQEQIKIEPDNQANSRSQQAAASASAPQQPIKGPQRLLRLLPRESRHIVARMLEIDPMKRATMEEIANDRWIKSGHVCQQVDSDIVRQGTHEHTLEPGSGTTPSNSKKD